MSDYGPDVLAGRRRRPSPPPRVPAVAGLLVEHRATGFGGEVIAVEAGAVTLRDDEGRERVFRLDPGVFVVAGCEVTLERPRATTPAGPRRTASGSVAAPAAPARVARAGRILVEGVHDAELVELVWGDDLRVEGVAVEVLDGVDDLPAVVRDFAPGPGRRLGVLVDHLVPGSKEDRLARAAAHPHLLVAGHPYVDIWQAVRPAALGIAAWPAVPRGRPWKEGVGALLGEPDPRALWLRIRGAVGDWRDLEQPLVRAVEELIDFVTATGVGRAT